MGVTQGAGLSFQWFRNRLAAGAEYDDLTAEATLSPLGAQGLFWLPYLMGERTPHLDALARAAWVGLTAKHNRADLIRSILEGVCYSQRDCLELIAAMGAPVTLVRLSGGGAASPFWHQLFADIFRKRVVTLETKEGSAYGAALLSMVGTGEFASATELCNLAIHEASAKEPENANADYYDKSYKIFRSLYPALKPANEAIAALGVE
jgi:xylulokinase